MTRGERTSNKPPLEPKDFPVHVDGKTIKKQDGKPIAKSEDPATAADVAERLNEDADRREEDNWSAITHCGRIYRLRGVALGAGQQLARLLAHARESYSR